MTGVLLHVSRLTFWSILVVLLAAPAHGQTSAPAVSADRISRGLSDPAITITIPPIAPADDTPTFRIKVEGGWPLETPLDAIRRELAAESKRTFRYVHGTAGGAPPLVTVDLLAVYGSIKQAWHEHAEREAKQAVAADLAAFCAINDCSRDRVAPEGVIVARPLSAPQP
jgi:hypothetical protein